MYLEHIIKNDDYVSKQEEEEPKQHSVVSRGNIVCLLTIDDQFGDDMVSSSLVKKMGFEIDSDAMPYHVNIIRQDKSRQSAAGRFIVKVSNGIKNMNAAQGVIIANSIPPSVREGMGISSGLLLFRKREMMAVYVEKPFLNLTKSEYAIVMSKNKESNPTSCTAPSVGQVQEFINELPKSEEQTQLIMKDMQHILVTVLGDSLYSCFNSKETRNLLEHVESLPTEGTRGGVVRKSESICAKPASAIPEKQGNRMISYLCPKIIVKNGHQETCIPKETEWKTLFKPITEFREFLVMSTKRSNQPKLLWTDQTRRLYNNLNGYYGMIEMQPSIQELLTLTIPSSGKDMAGMKLINKEVNMCAILLIIMENHNRSWRMYMDGQDVNCYIHCQDCIVGLFCRLLKYSKISLDSPYHQIIFNHRGELNKRLHALARIHEQLVFAIGLHIDWGKCYTLGEPIVIPHVNLHANDIIAEKENNITPIHDLTTLAHLRQVQNHQGLGWFHILLIKSCNSMSSLLIDCTSRGKIRRAEKLRITTKPCTALEVVRKSIKDFKVHGGLSTSSVGAFSLKAREHKNLQQICVWNLGTFDVFNIIHAYQYHTKIEENSRTSSFEEGAPDAGQNVAQEPISFYYGQVLIGGPFKASWALGESLGPDTFVRQSPRDHQYL